MDPEEVYKQESYKRDSLNSILIERSLLMNITNKVVEKDHL